MGVCVYMHGCPPAPQAGGVASRGHRCRLRGCRLRGCSCAWEHPSLHGRVGWHAIRSNPDLYCCPGKLDEQNCALNMAGEDVSCPQLAVPPSTWRRCGHRSRSWRFPGAFASCGPAAATSSVLISVLWLPSLLKAHRRSQQGHSLHLCLSEVMWCEPKTEERTYSTITFAANRYLICCCAVCALLKALNLKAVY